MKRGKRRKGREREGEEREEKREGHVFLTFRMVTGRATFGADRCELGR